MLNLGCKSLSFNILNEIVILDMVTWTFLDIFREFQKL